MSRENCITRKQKFDLEIGYFRIDHHCRYEEKCDSIDNLLVKWKDCSKLIEKILRNWQGRVEFSYKIIRN